MSLKLVRRLSGLLACAAVLVGCGGGGDSDPPPTTPPPPPATTYTVGGTVSGLATGATVVLRLNGTTSASVAANGAYTFSTPLASGAAYAVTVLTQPASQNCTVAAGSGTVTAAVTNVAVTCTTNPPTVGGTLSGLATGGTVVLQNNAGNNLTVSANGAFTFTTPVATGGAYAVTVLTNPTVPGPGQVCTPTAATGTVATANVTSVVVTCVNVDVVAPTISSRTPLATAVGSKVQGGVVTVTFSEAVDTATVTSTNFSVATAAGPVAGAITFATGNTQAIFTPTASLDYDQAYTVTVSTGVRDPSGNALAASSAWSFNSGKKLAVGFLHTCARFDDGRVKCWGDNRWGQLGAGDTNDRGDGPSEMGAALPAVPLGTGRSAVAIAAGDYHTCVILDDGTSKCWGRNYDTSGSVLQGGALGQGATGNASHLGDGANEMGDNLPAINVGPGRTIKEIVGGQDSTCARLDNDTVKCWGINVYGQLGQGTTAPLGVAAGDIAAALPVDFGAGLTPVSITLGHHNGCAILTNGSGSRLVKCWGRSNWGQLGQGNTGNLGDGAGEMGSSLPTVSLGTGLTPEVVLSNGGHNCALLANGLGGKVIKCWGLNTWGQLGLVAGNSLPGSAIESQRVSCAGGTNDCIGDDLLEMGDALLAVPGIGTSAARLTVGFRHTCARTTTNTQLICWGSNEQGQLGLITGNAGADVIIGDEAGEANSLEATALTGAVIEEATVGGFHGCVWNASDTLNCWGWNTVPSPGTGGGQLGHSTTATFGDDNLEMNGLPVTPLGT